MNHRASVGIGFIIVTLAFMAGFPRVEIRTIFKDLLPKNDPFVQIYFDHPNFGNPLTVSLMVKAKNGDIYNAKTGALMPCPGTDKSFYVAAGLETPKQAKPAPIVSNIGEVSPPSTAPVAAAPVARSPVNTQSSTAAQSGCKSTIHKKTGGSLPCPPQD
jgi:hypothetical protein